MLFTELGTQRTEQVFKKKMDDIYKVGKEPVPIQGLVRAL